MKKISILLFVVVAALTSCKKTPEVNLKYVDIERDLVTVGSTTANIQCDYDYITTLKKAFIYYGVGEDEENMTSAEMRVVQASLYVELTGLIENTTYGYYYEFVNGFNSMRSEVKTFKTESMPVPPPEITLPTVITSAVTDISTNSATCGGEITNDGGAEVTERGICWSTNENPTLSDDHIAIDSTLNVFTAIMTGLEENTTYHVRAYAANEKGTAYGLDMMFVTENNIPVGAINGLFTINANGDQVYFSQGNLQYQASTNTWRFAEHQWDFVGDDELGTVLEDGVKCTNNYISIGYSGWIDLFGWGTSGFDHGSVCYQPWSISMNERDYYAYGQRNYNLYDSTGMADWGMNPIINGGNRPNCWRTPTVEEWDNLLNNRNTESGIRYAKACVNDIRGVVLFPDNWNSNIVINSVNQSAGIFMDNCFSLTEWERNFEPFGAVFLPITGYRRFSSINIADAYYGGYYSSSAAQVSMEFSPSVYHLLFQYQSAGTSSGSRDDGLAVRLIYSPR